ncbi:MAG: hypothetical protein QXL34_06130 [Thermosphaera sp.]
MRITTDQDISSSFRDPSGFLFSKDGTIYRQVNLCYREYYDNLMNSGLYKTLVDAELLIPHEEVEIEAAQPERAYKIIRPEQIPFISYPYEWSFSQLKDAALITLETQKIALKFEMSLKDCSAYNIQFRKGKPILIDTLSFERYHEGKPWIAYRQFCQHFLAPLVLMSYKDIRLNQLLRVYIDGIPLDLASRLLPARTYFKFSFLSHIHLHALSQRYFGDRDIKLNINNHGVSKLALLGLIDSLESAINKLKWQPKGTQWADYYQEINYFLSAFEHKKQIVAEFLDRIKPKNIWDLGANDGTFSRIAAAKGITTLSFDVDPACVEKNYLECRKNNETNVLPLLQDLTNPSPAIGWENKERMSFLERGPADAVLALALIHHLAIGNNLSLNKIAELFGRICHFLIIEFVPKNDPQVKRMLLNRNDIFTDYTEENFNRIFSQHFLIQDSIKIKDSERSLYLMKKK